MKLKEYLALNGVIITPSMVSLYPFLTTEGQDSINNKFEFELGDLSMFYEDTVKVQAAVNYILLKNKQKYTEIDKTLKLVVPLEYQRLITHEGSNKEDINKTINVIGGSSTTEEGTITKDGNTSHNNTIGLIGEQNNTNTISKETNLKSVKGFDGIDFVDSEKNETVKELPDTTKVTTNDTTTDNGTVTVLDTDTIERLTTVENESDTTDTTGIIGSENYTEKEQSIEVLDRIEQYRALYSLSLWDLIVEDIKKVICLSIWE